MTNKEFKTVKSLLEKKQEQPLNFNERNILNIFKRRVEKKKDNGYFEKLPQQLKNIL